MILRIAWKNFVGQGMRAFLNTLVTALTLVAVVFNISLYNGFQGQATRNMIRTDVAGGHYRMKEFDILPPTQWEDHTFTVPDQIRNAPSDEKAEVLVQQGQIFPKRRLFPVQLRGIEMDQSLIDLPFDKLRELGPEDQDVRHDHEVAEGRRAGVRELDRRCGGEDTNGVLIHRAGIDRRAEGHLQRRVEVNASEAGREVEGDDAQGR